ncbi:MAG: YnbE family lipoprotein [Myxococcota bacterium]|nr:YnbE family lipoprotein [Myxococcota bacterium]
MNRSLPLHPELLVLAVLLTGALLACTPTVQVAPPAEPITINLNVKIEHEIKVQVDKELDELFEEEEGLF